MITKFARLEFELFTKPSKSGFLRVHHPLIIKQDYPFHPKEVLGKNKFKR